MVKLLTGNELLRGDVLWWTASGWSLTIDDAIAVDAEGEALLAEQAKAEKLCELALIDAEQSEGRWRPLKIRERIRAYGPTVRADLALDGQDWR
ncbi:MAG: DUF2849 domain-containing protein [Sandaracinobacteroides sp.]